MADETREHAPSRAPGNTSRDYATVRGRLFAGSAMVALLLAGGVLTAKPSLSAGQLFSSSEMAGAQTPARAAAVPGFVDLVAAVKPAVVSVRVRADNVTGDTASNDGFNPFRGTPFERFFRGNPEGNGAPQHHMVQALGSGFFVSADGYIVTNNHVVDNASEVSIITDGGNTLKAKVVGTDKLSDLALLKVDGKAPFPFVKLAQATPKVGEWVVAMGNPFGLGGTVTAGIVSAEGRDIGSGPYDDYIQIDAPVNRGNSGGPTFNLNGEVVGVNTAIYSPSGGSVGIAFDIPYTTIASVIPQLQSQGHVTRGWLGVQIQTVTQDIANGLGLAEAKGALVAEPQANSPALQAGMKTGDVIRSIDGHDVATARDLARQVASLGPGKSVDVGVIRDGKATTIRLTIGELKEKATRQASAEGGSKSQVERLGLTVAPAGEIAGAGSEGLAVVGVDDGGRAALAGIQAGDIIVKAGGRAVSTPQDLSEAIGASRKAGRSSTLVLLKRGQQSLFVAIPDSTG